MITHNKSGQEYAKLSETVVGMTLYMDSGFTCMCQGPHKVLVGSLGDLYVSCDEGNHLLSGQCDECDHMVGITNVPEE